jgi:hypothetical protein
MGGARTAGDGPARFRNSALVGGVMKIDDEIAGTGEDSRAHKSPETTMHLAHQAPASSGLTLPALLAAAFTVLSASSAIAADNANSCIHESTGLGGYQFSNHCMEDIRIFMRHGSGPTGGSNWGALLVGPGQTRVVSSYASPFVACPLSRDGRGVTLDEKNRRCTYR